jgi:hypothetical protein
MFVAGREIGVGEASHNQLLGRASIRLMRLAFKYWPLRYTGSHADVEYQARPPPKERRRER